MSPETPSRHSSTWVRAQLQGLFSSKLLSCLHDRHWWELFQTVLLSYVQKATNLGYQILLNACGGWALAEVLTKGPSMLHDPRAGGLQPNRPYADVAQW